MDFIRALRQALPMILMMALWGLVLCISIGVPLVFIDPRLEGTHWQWIVWPIAGILAFAFLWFGLTVSDRYQRKIERICDWITGPDESDI